MLMTGAGGLAVSISTSRLAWPMNALADAGLNNARRA